MISNKYKENQEILTSTRGDIFAVKFSNNEVIECTLDTKIVCVDGIARPIWMMIEDKHRCYSKNQNETHIIECQYVHCSDCFDLAADIIYINEIPVCGAKYAPVS